MTEYPQPQQSGEPPPPSSAPWPYAAWGPVQQQPPTSAPLSWKHWALLAASALLALVGVLSLIVSLDNRGGGGGQDVALAPSSAAAEVTTSATPSEEATFVSRGTIQVQVGGFPDGVGQGLPCTTDGGYDNIRDGAQVLITNGGGETLAVGRLGPGKQVALRCEFSWVVQDVPRGEGFYEVQVAGRGGPQYSEQDMLLTIDLTLG